MLLVLYPEVDSASQRNWRAIGAALAAAGLRVPELFDDAPEMGAALEEDLGDVDLAHEIATSPARGPQLLDEAEELLIPIRNISRKAAALNPPFDREFFARELAHTRLWLLEGGGGKTLVKDRAAEWSAGAEALAGAAANPAECGDFVPTHRDFHANNLMRAPEGRLASIDFQDLRLGPPDYDPVSLRFERAAERVPEEGSSQNEAVLLQRAWKVLGTFEKMLHHGREVYRPHRDAAVRVIRQRTSVPGRFTGLLDFLPRG